MEKKELKAINNINSFLSEFYKYSDEKINSLTIQTKMHLVLIRDESKWEEFKIDLRNLGYII